MRLTWVANQMFASVFAFLDADHGKQEQVLTMLGDAHGTA
jgi:hypothetical protein